MNRREKISLTTTIISTGFFGAVAYHYFMGVYLGYVFPLNTFLPGPVVSLATLFGDWTGAAYSWPSQELKGAGLPFSYFPAAYFIFHFFGLFESYEGRVLFPISIMAIYSFVWIFLQLRQESRIDSFRNAVIGCLMCYPFLFIMQTGNAEGFLFICLSLFAYFHEKEKPLLSAFFLAFPIAMKAVAGVFLFLLLFEKRYRQAAFTVGWVIFLTMAALLYFDGGILDGFGAYLERLRISQDAYSKIMIVGDGGNHWGHSILTMIRILWAFELPEPSALLMPWTGAAAILFSGLLFVTYLQKERWARIALLVCAMNLLPFTSTDYKLMHLWIPLGMLINSKREHEWDAFFVALLALLLIPKNYGFLNNIPKYSYACVLNPILMITICGGLSYLAFRQRKLHH